MWQQEVGGVLICNKADDNRVLQRLERSDRDDDSNDNNNNEIERLDSRPLWLLFTPEARIKDGAAAAKKVKGQRSSRMAKQLR